MRLGYTRLMSQFHAVSVVIQPKAVRISLTAHSGNGWRRTMLHLVRLQQDQTSSRMIQSM